jgi:gamma-glutamyltranspeptidase/glutathione hydrolase
MSLDRLLPKAIDYAQNGFPLDAELRDAIRDRLGFLKQSPPAAETFYRNGQLPEVGKRLLQPRLAESLKILADRGPDAFYRGPLGEALIALCESDGGLIGPQDLAHGMRRLKPLTGAMKSAPNRPTPRGLPF